MKEIVNKLYSLNKRYILYGNSLKFIRINLKCNIQKTINLFKFIL